MDLPLSADCVPTKENVETGDVLIIIDGQRFFKSVKDALDISARIILTANASLNEHS